MVHTKLGEFTLVLNGDLMLALVQFLLQQIFSFIRMDRPCIPLVAITRITHGNLKLPLVVVLNLGISWLMEGLYVLKLTTTMVECQQHNGSIKEFPV